MYAIRIKRYCPEKGEWDPYGFLGWDYDIIDDNVSDGVFRNLGLFDTDKDAQKIADAEQVRDYYRNARRDEGSFHDYDYKVIKWECEK